MNQAKGKPTIAALMSDEMYIRKQYHWDKNKKKMIGTVDLNQNEDYDTELATQAFVFLITAINDDWKIPIGYFNISRLSADDRAQLVKEVLSFIKMDNLQITHYVFDGTAVNLKAAAVLGARVEIVKETYNIKPFFKNPANPNEEILTLIDICHGLKLVRNTFKKLKEIEDHEGLPILWNKIELLFESQMEGLSLGTKLTINHLEFEDQKMKVYLAAQLLSKRVADAIEYKKNVEEDPGFEDAQGTINFLRIFDRCFDVLNTRNKNENGFKQVDKIL